MGLTERKECPYPQLHEKARVGNVKDLENYTIYRGNSIETEINGLWDNHTPLMLAAEKGHLDCVKYLIGVCGADPFMYNAREETALDFAFEGGNPAVVSFLIKVESEDIIKNDHRYINSVIKYERWGLLSVLINNGAPKDQVAEKVVKSGRPNALTAMEDIGYVFSDNHLLIAAGKHKLIKNFVYLLEKYWTENPAIPYEAIERHNLLAVEILHDKRKFNFKIDYPPHLNEWNPFTQVIKRSSADIMKYFIHKIKVDYNSKIHGKSPLTIAIEAQNIETADILCEMKALIDQTELSKLNVPILDSWIKVLKYLIEKFHYDIIKWNPQALYLAISNKQQQIAYYLCTKGAQVSNQNELDDAIALCIKNNYIDILAHFIQSSKTLVNREIGKQSLLYLAIETNQDGIIKLLINNGAVISNESHLDVALLTCICNKKVEVFTYFIQNLKVSVNRTINGKCLLFLAIEKSSENIINLLINNGAVISNESHLDVALLKCICNTHFNNILIYLVQNCSLSVNREINGECLLYLAMEQENNQIVDFLVEHNAIITSPEQLRKSLKHFCSKGDISFVRILTSKLVDRDIMDECLYESVINSQKNIVEHLISMGAIITETTRLQKALACACRQGYIIVVESHVPMYYAINSTDNDGNTLLHHVATGCYTSETERYRIANYLLSKGALLLKNNNGMHPQDLTTGAMSAAFTKTMSDNIEILSKTTQEMKEKLSVLISELIDVEHKGLSAVRADDFQILEFLGKGSFGLVFSAKCTHPRIPNKEKIYALKLCYKNFHDRESIILEGNAAEFETLSFIPPHPNIVMPYAHLIDRIQYDLDIVSSKLPKEMICGRDDGVIKVLYLVYPKYDCSLAEILPIIAPVDEVILHNIAKQILLALVHLEQNAVIHCDIKSENILIAKIELPLSQIHVGIGDFGLSKLETTGVMVNRAGNAAGWPPEVYNARKGNMVDYSKYDIFSTGVLLFNITTINNKNPFFGMSKCAYKDTDVPKIPETYSKDLRELVHKMLSYYPHKRPSAAECLEVIENASPISKDNRGHLTLEEYKGLLAK